MSGSGHLAGVEDVHNVVGVRRNVVNLPVTLQQAVYPFEIDRHVGSLYPESIERGRSVRGTACTTIVLHEKRVAGGKAAHISQY